jgi:hypothetical protein
MKRTICLATAVFVFLVVDIAYAMEFRDAGNGGNCYSCSWTVAEGEITYDTPRLFEKFVSEQAAKGSGYGPIVIDSPGGDLFAGLELGRMFRKLGVRTFVAKSKRPAWCSADPESTSYCSDYFEEIYPGLCASACAYAFLGGTVRTVAPQNSYTGHELSKIGFHQFYSTLNKSEKILEILKEETLFSKEQITSAFILQYLTEMEVDPNIMGLAALAGPNKMYFPNKEERERYLIDYFPDVSFSELQMEAYRGGLISFLSPNHDMIGLGLNGMEQITFFCNSEDPFSILFTLKNTGFNGPKIGYGASNKIKMYFDKGYDSLYQNSADFEVVLESTKHWHSVDRNYFKFQINSTLFQNLSKAKNVVVNFDLARVYGRNAAYFEIGDQFMPILALTAKNCFE